MLIFTLYTKNYKRIYILILLDYNNNKNETNVRLINLKINRTFSIISAALSRSNSTGDDKN